MKFTMERDGFGSPFRSDGMQGLPGSATGWLPSSVRKASSAGAGVGPAKSARIAVACKPCKTAKAKCDLSRPCRRCLYKQTQDKCIAGDEGPSVEDSGESKRASKRPRTVPHVAGSVQLKSAGAGKQEEPVDDEYFEVSLPSLDVLEMSPALALRYSRVPFTGPVGTSLLHWVYEHDLLHVVDQIVAPDTHPAHSRATPRLVKLIVIRSAVAEMHECTLTVEKSAHRDVDCAKVCMC